MVAAIKGEDEEEEVDGVGDADDFTVAAFVEVEEDVVAAVAPGFDEKAAADLLALRMNLVLVKTLTRD